MSAELTLGYATGVAFLTRAIVEEFKERGWVDPKDKIIVIALSFGINLALAMLWALWDGADFNVVLIRGLVQATASGLYHDFKKAFAA